MEAIKITPKAQGYGAFATKAGREGAVYLADRTIPGNSGNETTRVGSLEWCLRRPGPKIIFFLTGGEFDITHTSLVSLSQTWQQGFTVLGQSANGDGVTIKGSIRLTSGFSDFSFQHVRIRAGQNATSRDCLSVTNDCRRYYIGNCSFSWGTDETASFDGTEASVVNCIIAECLNNDDSAESSPNTSYGTLTSGRQLSYYGNLWINNNDRNPRLGDTNTAGVLGPNLLDITNCVIVNWGTGAVSASGILPDREDLYLQIRNSLFIQGPATWFRSAVPDHTIYVGGRLDSTRRYHRIHLSGNRLIRRDGTYSSIVDGNNFNAFNLINIPTGSNLSAEKANVWSATLFPQQQPIYDEIRTADQALTYIVANCGAKIVRDSVDERLINEAVTRQWIRLLFSGDTPLFAGVPQLLSNTALYSTQKTGSHPTDGTYGGHIDDESDVGGSPTIATGSANVSTAGDGLPDSWKASKGLDINVDYGIAGTPTSHPYLYHPSGYRWHEIYCHERSGEWVELEIHSLSIVIPTNGTVSNAAGNYEASTLIPLTAQANEGYEFKKWINNETGQTVSLIPDFNFIMPSADVTLSAVFELIPAPPIDPIEGPRAPFTISTISEPIV